MYGELVVAVHCKLNQFFEFEKGKAKRSNRRRYYKDKFLEKILLDLERIF